MIPDVIAKRPDLSFAAKCVLGYIVRKAQNGVWTGGVRLLAKLWGSGTSRVLRAISELERAELIQVERGKSGQRSRYLLSKAVHSDALCPDESASLCAEAVHSDAQARHSGARKRQRPSETKKRISSKPKSERVEQAERIWQAYPKKIGKKATMPIIVEALKVTDFETILSGVKRYVAFVAGEDDHFTMHPERWFRKARWADELGPKKSRPGRVEAPPGKYPAEEGTPFGDQP